MKAILLKKRRLIAELMQAVIAAVSFAVSFLLRFDFTIDHFYASMLLHSLPLLVAVKITVFRGFGLRDLAWREIGFPDLMRIGTANLAASGAATLVLGLVIGPRSPRSIHALDFFVCLTLLVAVRAAVKLLLDRQHCLEPAKSPRRSLIYGAGRTGIATEIRLEDLLGRLPARWGQSDLQRHLSGRTVLVTGAGGSIGSELCRQIARHRPKALIGFDQAETALYQIEQELREWFPTLEFLPAVGNIQNQRRVDELFQEHRPQSVYHAAAYKHVPLMESHVFEAVENNVLGTRNLTRAASEHGADEFVLVSSDKAVRPASVMGATKRVAEMICQAEPSGATRFLAVRFGNVLGSSGSVIPNFRRQIESGGPVTVTHPDMRRYFMTIPEAAQLVLRAGTMGSGGEIFVLEMGEPVRILDLARKMILLSGLRPDIDIPIVFSGTRPGEKLCEEVSALEENTFTTPHSQIRVFSGPTPSSGGMRRMLEQLERATEDRDAAQVVLCLQKMVPGYTPSYAPGAVLSREAKISRAQAVSA